MTKKPKEQPTTDGLQPPVAGGPKQQPKFKFASGKDILGVLLGREKELFYAREQDKLVFDAVDRVPPYDPKELADDGEEWRTNADFGDFEGQINDKVEKVNNLLTQPCPFVDLRFKRDTDPTLMERMELFNYKLHEWLMSQSAFVEEVQSTAFHMVNTGVGWVLFGVPFSWQFTCVPRSNVIYPKGAKRNFSKLEWVGFRSDFPITDLIAKLDPERSSAAAAVGWQMPVIKQVVANLKFNDNSVGNIGTLENSPEKWVESVTSQASVIASQNGQNITVYHMYTREYDGKVSWQIVHRSTGAVTGTPDDVVLFKSTIRYDCYSKFIVPFWLSIGSQYIEKCRGFGHRILPQCAVQNDLDCRGIDTTILSGSLMLKATGGADDLDKAQRNIKLGSVVTLIPDDMALDQKSFSNPAQGIIALSNNLRARRAANSRVFGGPDAAQQQPTGMSATHARMVYTEATAGGGYEADRLNIAANALHNILMDRLVAIWSDPTTPKADGYDDAKAFWDDASEFCQITTKDLKQITGYKAVSLFGDGDPNQVFLALSDLASSLPALPLSSQKEALRMMIAARTRKPHLAFKWLPIGSTQADREMSLQSWRTSQEEGQFEGSDIPVPVQDDDNNLVHAESHTMYAVGVVDSWNKGSITPEVAFAKIFRCRAHTMVHLQRLAADKRLEGATAKLNKQWQGIDNMARRMQQMVQEAAQAARARQIEELRNPKLTVKEQQDAMTAELQRQQMKEKHAAELQIMQERSAAEIQLAKRQSRAKSVEEQIRNSPTVRPLPPEKS